MSNQHYVHQPHIHTNHHQSSARRQQEETQEAAAGQEQGREARLKKVQSSHDSQSYIHSNYQNHGYAVAIPQHEHIQQQHPSCLQQQQQRPIRYDALHHNSPSNIDHVDHRREIPPPPPPLPPSSGRPKNPPIYNTHHHPKPMIPTPRKNRYPAPPPNPTIPPPPPAAVTAAQSQINPSQLPFLKPPTFPISRPAKIYKTSTDPKTFTSSPPASDTRYIIQDNGNASPRMLKSICQIIPKNSSIKHKTGLDMGVLSIPLAVPTEDFSNNEQNNLEFVPLIHSFHENHSHGRFSSTGTGTAHLKLTRQQQQQQQQQDKKHREGAVKPIRCRYCQAYLNPFVILERMEANHRAVFQCNFCEKRNDISLLAEEKRSNFHVDADNLPLRYGSVEYEVDGEYILRDKNRKWGSVHLFALDGGDWDKLHVYLKVLANAVEEMDKFWKQQKRYMTRTTGVEHVRAVAGEGDGTVEDNSPRIGFFVYVQNLVLIPHWKRKGRKTNGSDERGWELSVSLMADVKENPFAPLPVASWTYAVGDVHPCNSHGSVPLHKLYELIQQVPSVLKEMVPDYKCREAFSPADSNSWNCGGAALSILCHALHGIGGHGTLLTSSRLNYGIGALADRQGNSTMKYAKTANENALYTPQQVLQSDVVGEYYKKLGKLCIQESVSLSIIMSTSMCYEDGSGVIGTHYVDVASLAELCRHSCGDFKWLKHHELGNCHEENIALDNEGSYAHQLKEEFL